MMHLLSTLGSPPPDSGKQIKKADLFPKMPAALRIKFSYFYKPNINDLFSDGKPKLFTPMKFTYLYLVGASGVAHFPGAPAVVIFQRCKISMPATPHQ